MPINAPGRTDDLFRALIERSTDAITLITSDGSILYASPSTQRVTGYRADELIGLNAWSLVHPDDLKQVQEQLASILDHPEAFTTIEYRLSQRDGAFRWMEATVSNCLADPIIGALMSTAHDITARKQAEEEQAQALKQSEELLRIALRNSPIAVYQQNRDLRYTWIYNPLLGSTPEDVVGKMDQDIVSPQEAQQLAELKQCVMRSGERVRTEFQITRAVGVSWQVLTIEPLRDNNGAIIGVTGAAVDITDRKELEEELKRLEREAARRAGELEAIFEAITDAVVVFDAEGHVVRMNQSARDLLPRYLPSSDIEQSMTQREQQALPRDWEGHLLVEETSPTFRLLRGETLVGIQSQDVAVTTHDGDQLLLNIAGAPLRDTAGNQIGAVAVTRDLTEQRRLEQRTQRALEALFKMAQVIVQIPELDEQIYNAGASGLRRVAQQIAELARDVLGCERLSLHQVEPETELLQPLAVVGLSAAQEQAWWIEQAHATASLSDALDPTLIDRLRQQEALVLDMTRPPWNEVPNPYGIVSMLIVPLCLKANLIGLLQLDYRGQPHVYTPEEIALTQAAGRLIALIIERENLLALNQRLSDLIDLAHDAVIVRNPANQVQLWNQGAELLYGWSKQEVMGKVTHNLLATRFPVSREAVDAQLDEAGQWEGILAHTRRDGEEVLVESRQVLVRTATGERAAILEINRDITERERLARERTEAQANELAVREAYRLMDEFLGIAGHELRTPLTTIKASVQLAGRQLDRLLKQDELSADLSRQLLAVQTHLDRSGRQIALQNRLVSDLLDVSRIQAGLLELYPDLCDLVTIVREVVEDHQYLAPERRLILSVLAPGELLVLADADRVRQVVSNYLSNALKYSESVKPVKIGVEVIDGAVYVSVQDEGPGLSPEQQQRVWERFYRAPGVEVRTGSGVGLGLGLHISRMIIERQRGRVGIQSEPDQGSTFWFTLPLAEQ